MDYAADTSKRDFMKTVIGIGGVAAATGLLSGAGSVKEAYAQLLETSINPSSMLAKMKKDGKLKVGYSQTVPWFQKDAKTGKLEGIYYEAVERLAQEIEIKVEYLEADWVNATVGLRKGDYDLFGSSLFYTMPRALVVSYIGPLWSKGRLALTHRDFAGKFKSAADFNKEDVIFSVNVGSAEENWAKTNYPKAKVITTTGNIALSLEPVRTKRAHLYASGEENTRIVAAKNKWAQIVDEKHPIGLNANTWAIRYNDPDWQAFLEFWTRNLANSGWVKERYDFHVAKAAAD